MINFYSADTSATHIIGYGEVYGKKMFKITYHNGLYFSHKLNKKKYHVIGETANLDDAKILCLINL